MAHSSNMSKAKRQQSKDIFFSFLVLAYLSAFYCPYLFSGATSLLPSYQDESQWLLYHAFINQSFSQGFFPLWTPDLFCGMPFLAWSHAAALYPLNVIFAVFDYGQAVWINQWVHALIYGLGLFFLCRKAGGSRFSSFLAVVIGGAVFISGGVGNFLPNIRTGSYAPLLFLSILGMLRDRRFFYLVLFSVVNLLMYLGGQVELIGLGYEVAAVILIVGGVYYRKQPRLVAGSYLLFGFSFLLGYLASLVQSLPTLELTHYSIRGAGLSYGYFTIWSSPRNLTVWLPYLASGVALVPLIKAIISVRRSVVLLLTFTGLLYCIFLIHDLFGILWLVYQVPLLKGLLAHSRILFHAQILIMVMIALGTDSILNSAHRSAWLRAAGAVSMLVVLAWFLLPPSVTETIASSGEPNMRPSLLQLFNCLDYLMPAAFIISVLLLFSYRLEHRWKPFPSFALLSLALVSYAAPWLYAMPENPRGGFDFPPEYVSFMSSRKGLQRTQNVYSWKSWEKIGIPLQAGILHHTRAMDGYITVSVDRYTRFLDALVPSTFQEKDGKIADLEATRVLKEGVFVEDRTIPWLNFMGLAYVAAEKRNLKFATHYFLAYPDSPFLGKESNARVKRSYDNQVSDRLMFQGRACGGLHVQPGDRLNMGIPAAGEGKWTTLSLNSDGGSSRLVFARFLSDSPCRASGIELSRDSRIVTACFASFTPEGEISRSTLIDPVITNQSKYFQRVPLSTSRFNIFQNPEAMPPATLVSRARLSERERILKMIKQNRLDPRQEALVERGLPHLSRMPLRPGEGVKTGYYSPEKLRIKTSALVNRLMVLSDVYYPGWKAFIEGKEKPILPANYAFRGVVVPPGNHEVTMTYQPAAFRIGLWVTISSLAALLVMSFIRKRE